jgi:aminoglycoside phosphotransferase (APT) family kinase protein
MAATAARDLDQRLAAVLGATEVTDVVRLTGGASRETYRFTADGRPLILQRQRPGADRTMSMEVSVLRAAHDAGVAVARLIDSSDDPAALGAAYMICEAIEGETIARKIQRDDTFAAARGLLAGQFGEALARLHAIDPATVSGLDHADQLNQQRELLDLFGQPHPTFELALRWLEANRPVTTRTTVVHGDFRLGNVIVGPDGLRAVLDWELAHLGDPMEDLGWLCVKAWRFGGAPPVAGLGSYDELFAAYERASGITVDPTVVRWWEVLGTLKWGIICIMQTNAHLTGVARSHELAAIGRRVCENEWDIFLALEGVW